MNKALQKKLKDLPRAPGVYFHKSQAGEVIYVGKAAVLRNRVRQYFHSSRAKDVKTTALVEEIADVDWLETDSETDALFLESEMVKRYMPRYNILLRDDKSQLYVRIDLKSEWPSVSFTRHPVDDGAEYFGPYYNGRAVRKALRYLRRTFPYFTKPPANQKQRSRLNAHIGLEPTGTAEEYRADLGQLMSYLRGNRKSIMRQLEKAMKQAADQQDFERAAALRNRLRNLMELKNRIMFGDSEFLDISSDRALVQLQDLLGLAKIPAQIEGFDVSHTSGSQVVASQVVFMNGTSYRTGYRKYKMSVDRNDDTANIYEAVYRRLSPRNLKSWGRPDIMIIDGGKGQVAAAIRARQERCEAVPIIGLAKRQEWLYIHQELSCVKTTQLEVLLQKPVQGVTTWRDGDFFVVNLHSGQVNAGSHSRNLSGGTNSAMADLLKLLQRIRDEAHRFAVSYHSSLARQAQTKSQLEQVPGVGPATRRKLIKAFGSLKGVKEADESALAEVTGPALARQVKAHFKA